MAGQSMGWRLRCEALEDRVVPAGNVTAVLGGGTLRIRGDDADNIVVVTVPPAPGFSALGGDDTGRLFAVLADGSNAIVELNPATGAEVNRFLAPESVSGGPDGLAFDGHSLFYINGFGTLQLWELDPDTGAVIDADAIGVGSGGFDGLAALGGTVYVLDYGFSDIIAFDPVADVVTGVLDVDALNPGATLVGGLAGITGPDALIATVNFGQTAVVEIDPATGLITGSFSPADTYYGLAVVGGDIYLGSPSGYIDVYSRAGVQEGTITFPRNFLVYGVDTLVNGVAGPVSFAVPANVDIRLGDGSDVAQVSGVTLSGGLSVKESGDGNDATYISLVTLGGGLDVDAGAGNDTVIVDSSTVGGSARVTTGSGDDYAVLFSLSVGQSLAVDAGQGNDYAEVDFVSVGGGLSVLTGQGDDTAFMYGNQVAGRTTVDMAAGADQLYLFYLTTGSLSVGLGAGDDIADFFGVQVADGLGVVDGGAGADLFFDEGSNSGFTRKSFV